MASREQMRSEFTLMQIEEKYKGKVDADTANFFVGLPTMILTNGLGQSLAFLLSNKKKDKYYTAYNVIKKWLINRKYCKEADTDLSFIKELIKDQHTYRSAQQEVLSMLNWLKRYARAFEIQE